MKTARKSIVKFVFFLGVAAAGISRLLLPMDIYQSCQGGMTLLGDFRPGNISLTTLNADFVVHPWQVRANVNCFIFFITIRSILCFRVFSSN